MSAAALAALVLAVVVGAWAATEKAWPVLLLAVAVVLLAVAPELEPHIH